MEQGSHKKALARSVMRKLVQLIFGALEARRKFEINIAALRLDCRDAIGPDIHCARFAAIPPSVLLYLPNLAFPWR